MSPLRRQGSEGAKEAGKEYAVVIVGCAMRSLKWALWILFVLLAPKLLRKARHKGKTAAHRARVKMPKQVKKMRRGSRRSIVP